MCGIAGWLGSSPEPEINTRLVQTLRHRGPDGHGIQAWPDATLIHTRLSIIDLSPTGAQPMANEDESIWVTFNGEIYNHQQLRKSLAERGHRFSGRSDTEVLPHLYQEEGLDFVPRLQGMFAFAIYDKPKKTLILARDRFGIKPLFYSDQNDRFCFASEIRALLQFSEIDTRLDKQAIYDFAALFYVPAPQTIYRGIRALEPGEMLIARLDQGVIRCHIEKYYRWTIAPDPSMTLTKAADKAEELVTGAVKNQLESDVPLGALLSGGIDSSLVSVAAQQMLDAGLRTFNVRFADCQYDETWAAQSVANHIGSNHETLSLQHAEGSWDNVTSLLSHAGQPFADTSLFAANAVCRLIRQHVTVALSGDGGDEAFGGYSQYWELARIANLQRLPTSLWWAGKKLLTPLARREIIPQHISWQVNELSHADDTAVVQSLFSYLSEDEHKAMFQDMDVLPLRRLFEKRWEHQLPGQPSRLERLSAHATEVNIRLVLANDFLFKVDTASMRESLEVRVPMLDERLFEFGLSVPHRLKVKRRSGKRILREVAARKLPPQVAQKAKMGFAVPVDTWIDAAFRERLSSFVLDGASKLPEFFRPSVYRPIVELFCKGKPSPKLSRRDSYRRVMMLLAAEVALRNCS